MSDFEADGRVAADLELVRRLYSRYLILKPNEKFNAVAAGDPR